MWQSVIATCRISPPTSKTDFSKVRRRLHPRGGWWNANRWNADRLSATVFGLVLLAAVPVLLTAGADYWFIRGDDWGLLLRDPGSVDGLFRPQHQHWSTVPVLVYALMHRLFGLNSYLPYQAATIVAHLGLVLLVRSTARRGGAGGWAATVATVPLVLFGAADQNLLLAVQVSMVGTMVCGFGHMALADHDGRLGRRDVVGWLVGLIGLGTSGMAPLFVGAVGLACLLRRGWRAAALHGVSLLAVYGLWYLSYRDDVTTLIRPASTELLAWASYGTTGVFLALGASTVAAVALGGVVIAGMGGVLRDGAAEWVRSRGAAPVSLAAAAPVLFAAVCWNRSFFGIETARAPRYLGIGAVLLTPLVAVALDRLARTHLLAGLAAGAVILAGVPSNVTLLFERAEEQAPDFAAQRRLVLGIGHSSHALRVHPETRYEPFRDPTETPSVGWLRRERAESGLPVPPPQSARDRADVLARLALVARGGPVTPAPDLRGDCAEPVAAVRAVLQVGDVIVIAPGHTGPVTARVTTEGTTSSRVRFDPAYGRVLEVQLDRLQFDVEATDGSIVLQHCGSP